jgi:hypothetical protein
MPRILNLTFRLVLSLWFTSSAARTAQAWEAVTSKKRPSCDSENPCRVLESNGSFEVKFTVEPKGALKTLRKVEIKNLKTGAIQPFELPEVNNIDEKDLFELFKMKLRPSHDVDLALRAYNSAREGATYYYFVYDREGQKFVLSESTFPKLAFDAKSKKYRTELQGAEYELGKDLKFTPAAR